MTFQGDIARFSSKVYRRQVVIFLDVANAILRSIKEGDPITGSPGQPVQSSDLKNSWQPFHMEPFLSQISTPMEYARPIEEGMSRGKKMTLRSEVGGFHSVKITRVGFQKLVNEVVRKVV